MFEARQPQRPCPALPHTCQLGVKTIRRHALYHRLPLHLLTLTAATAAAAVAAAVAVSGGGCEVLRGVWGANTEIIAQVAWHSCHRLSSLFNRLLATSVWIHFGLSSPKTSWGLLTITGLELKRTPPLPVDDQLVTNSQPVN